MTAAPQTPAHRNRCCATTAADGCSDRTCNAAQCHTQLQSDPATQRHSTLTTTHCRSRKSKSNMHTDTQTHSAAATHTATLHTQRARHKGSNTRRQRGSAHPPTTASSSVQRSHSRGHTQHLQHGVTVAAGSYTTAVRHCDCVALRLRHARSQDTCRTSAQHGLPTIAAAATLNTRATPLPHCNAAVTHACIQCSGTHAHTQSARNNRKQRCAVTRQPQRDAVQRRTCDNTKPQSRYCSTAPYSLRSRQRRQCTPYDAATMFTFSQAQCTPQAHVD